MLCAPRWCTRIKGSCAPRSCPGERPGAGTTPGTHGRPEGAGEGSPGGVGRSRVPRGQVRLQRPLSNSTLLSQDECPQDDTADPEASEGPRPAPGSAGRPRPGQHVWRVPVSRQAGHALGTGQVIYERTPADSRWLGPEPRRRLWGRGSDREPVWGTLGPSSGGGSTGTWRASQRPAAAPGRGAEMPVSVVGRLAYGTSF